MKLLWLPIIVMISTLLIAGCASPQDQTELLALPTNKKTPVKTMTETVSQEATTTLAPTATSSPAPLPTPTPIPPTQTPVPTPEPTLESDVRVIDLLPAGRCGNNWDQKQIFTVSWDNEKEFTYSYFLPGVAKASGFSFSSLVWKTYNSETGEEFDTVPKQPFNDDLYYESARKDIFYKDPYSQGFISPSGKYEIIGDYSKIWVAETRREKEWKILTDEYYMMAGADWSADESILAFALSYQGPMVLYVSEIKTRKSQALSELADVSGVTDYPWDLSPSGFELAYGDFADGLKIISTRSGQVTIVPGAGIQPLWSEDGNILYYWWQDQGTAYMKVDELRAYDMKTGEITTILDLDELVRGFIEFPDSNCLSEEFIFQQNWFAVSPDWGTVLVYDTDSLAIIKTGIEQDP